MNHAAGVPGGLRAGQLGVIVTGRVIPGDIAVTLVDLAQREHLKVEASPGNGDWQLSPLNGRRHGEAPLLEYEKTLLHALAARGGTSALSSLTVGFGRELDKVRAALVREAIHQGLVRHLHHDRRTPKGDDLALQLRAYRRDLRRLKSQQDQDALTGELLPFGLHFGVITDEQLPLVRFAHDWVSAFRSLPGWMPQQPARAPSDKIPGIEHDYTVRQISEAAFLLGVMP